jgi:amidase
MALPESMPAVVTRDASEITSWTAIELSQAIRARHVSCVEVMRAYLAQIERLNPQVNAIVSLQSPEDLLAQAGDRDAMLAKSGSAIGWMHGFPQAPKDLMSTAGIVTTLGSPLFKSFVPAHDSILVERVRRAGAILIGKTNVPEFGLGSHTYNTVFGTTSNAFDQTRSAGGSSGGAAVALALNLLPVADGSDFMGSLRNPAAWNNVFGFRPSFGRVPNGPAPEIFFQQFGIEGPMARTVADLSMLLSTIAGYDSRAPLSLDEDPAIFAGSLSRDLAGTRVGWLGDFDGYLPMEDGVLDTCVKSLAHFETIGCKVEATRPDFSMERLWQTWLVIRAFRVAGNLAAHYAKPELRALLKPEARWEVEQGMKLTAAELFKAAVDRSAWYQALAALFEHFDVLVLPSAQVFPFDQRLDWPKSIAGRAMDTYHRWMEVVIGPTLAGLPALNVPAGFGPGGLPMGLQIIGRPRADLQVLQIGHAYEHACGYTSKRSPLLRSAASPD